MPASVGYDVGRSTGSGDFTAGAAIARRTGVADVVAAVRDARERDLLVAVRSGGHGVGGHALCDGGLVIDLLPMKAIELTRRRGRRAPRRVLWGELDRDTEHFGLATVGGIVTHTGIAGFMLGGGIGWLMRKYGATVDNLLSVDLDGLRPASSSPQARTRTLICSGASAAPGANFGIVTLFEYRLHPVFGPIVLAGPIFHHLDDAPEVLGFYREFAASAPDELTDDRRARSPRRHCRACPRKCTASQSRWAPATPGRPRTGRSSAPAQGVELRVHRDRLEPKPYLALQSMFDPLVPHGWHRYWKSVELAAAARTMRSTRSSTTPRGSLRHARTPSSSSSAARSRAWPRTRPRSASGTLRTTSSSTPF